MLCKPNNRRSWDSGKNRRLLPSLTWSGLDDVTSSGKRSHGRLGRSLEESTNPGGGSNYKRILIPSPFPSNVGLGLMTIHTIHIGKLHL
jgi:hypothetical protein